MYIHTYFCLDFTFEFRLVRVSLNIISIQNNHTINLEEKKTTK